MTVTAQQNLKFNKQFFKDFWELFKPYWSSEEKWSAWGLFSLNIIFILAEVRANVILNSINKDFFNALQEFNRVALFTAFWHAIVVIVVVLFCFGYGFYFNQLLSVRWRRWLTTHYLDKWLSNHTHYRMRILDQNVDNPDQRISEDLAQFPTSTLTLFFLLFQSSLMLVSFGFILWQLSGDLTFPLAGTHIVIHGYLCWAALLYAIVGTWITGFMGRKLARLNYQQQQFNADFRFSLVRLRETSEQVAFYKGESAENKKFSGLFSKIFNNFINMISLQKKLMFFTNGYNNAAHMFGLAISFPLYLAKKIQLGGVMQISGAFSTVISSLSVFVNSFASFADWRSVIHRLAEFKRSMEIKSESISQISISQHPHPDIIINNLSIFTPEGRLLLHEVDLVLHSGKSILLSGKSGLGKSTMLRAIAGIWAHGKGVILIPNDQSMLFLPQKPYLPLGSLREVLLYPHVENINDQTLINTLEIIGLHKFINKLDENKNWMHELSLGEQQLIAFARIFLTKPDIIFLDEATSALDEEMELKMYKTIREFLPNSTIVSVGHRSSLHQFHEQVIVLNGSNPFFASEISQHQNSNQEHGAEDDRVTPTPV